ncbi:MAG: O-antigen ligase family protein [Chloroflexota bacterium]|nr:O-antigen ligase family protein [Chloroflexota bacterium]
MRLTLDTRRTVDRAIGGAAVGLVVLFLLLQLAPAPVLLAVALLAVLILALRAVTSPRWLRAGVLVGAGVSVIAVPLVTVGGVNLRLSQALLPLAFLALLLRTRGWLEAPRAGIWALLALLMVALFTLINPATRVSGLSQVSLFALNVLQFVLVYALARETEDGVDDCIRWLGWAAVLMAGWIGFLLLADRAGVPFVAPYFYAEGLARLVDGQIVFQVVRRFSHAMIAAGLFAGLLALFVALALDRTAIRWRFSVGAAVASFLGLMFAFGRGPILGALAGLLVVVAFSLRRSLAFTLRLLAIAAVVAVVGLVGLSRLPGGEEIIGVFLGRTMQLLDPATYESGTAAERLRLWSILLDDLEGNWLVGKGALAYRPLLFERYYGGQTDNPPASENILVELLHSGGLIALGAYLMLHLSIAGGLLRRSRAPGVARAAQLQSQALLSALVALGVASMLSPFAWNAMYWSMLGVMAAAAANDR